MSDVNDEDKELQYSKLLSQLILLSEQNSELEVIRYVPPN